MVCILQSGCKTLRHVPAFRIQQSSSDAAAPCRAAPACCGLYSSSWSGERGTRRGHGASGVLGRLREAMLGSPPEHSLLPASAAASPFPCSAGCQQQVKPQEFPSSGHLSISATFPSSSPPPTSFTLQGRRGRQGDLLGDQRLS